MLELALKEPALSPRELAVSFVDRQRYFISESSVYRLLKAHDLITSPAFILMKAAAHPAVSLSFSENQQRSRLRGGARGI